MKLKFDFLSEIDFQKMTCDLIINDYFWVEVVKLIKCYVKINT